MRLIGVVVIVFFGLAVFPVSTTIAQENDYLIVPGKRVGRWTLGKSIDAYGFPEQRGHWEGQFEGKPYHDGYSITIPPEGVNLWVFTCKSDGLVFELRVIRPVNRATQVTEATKYATAEGVKIGLDESEVLRILGQPSGTGQWSERHGNVEAMVRLLDYPGLWVLINRNDSKVFAIGAVKEGGWAACREAVLGRPLVAQPVNVPLPVPMPADLRIMPPASNIPPNRAAFSGVWVGKWDNILDTAVAVTEIDVTSVLGVYGVGSAPNIQPGWRRVSGRFAGPDELHLQVGAVLVVLRMRSDGRLDGQFGGGSRTILTKVFPK